MVSTSIIYHHSAEKCPCKNGEEHDWQPIKGIPTEYFAGRERCTYCDEERDTYTREERQKAIGDYVLMLEKKYPKQTEIKKNHNQI